MCGIVGVVLKGNTGLTKRIEDAFEQLLFVDTLRGDDSTGVIGVEVNESFHIMKGALEATWFLPQYNQDQISKIMWMRGKALIGHNRKGTIGKIKDDTAHPFVVDNTFAMVHNGTLYNHASFHDTEVDSHALAMILHKALGEEDHVNALEDILPKIYGAYAIAAYDQRTHKVFLLRNKDRPLFVAETEDAWFYASEGLMLQWILARNGYSAASIKYIESVPEDVLVTFDLTKNTMLKEGLSLKKAMAPTTMVVTVPSTSTETIKTTKTSFLSKNAFKALRKKLMHSVLEWWADDYVEKYFPKTFEEGEVLFNLIGECEDIKQPHMIYAVVDITATFVRVPDKLCFYKWTGTVDDVVYDQKNGSCAIYLRECSTIPSSKPATTVIDAAYIKNKLDEKEKTLLALH